MDNHIFNIINAICDGLLAAVLGGVVWLIRTVTRLESDVSWIKEGLIYNGRAAGMQVHSPHTPEFDKMLEDFWHDKLPEEQAPEFMAKLKAASVDPSYDKPHQLFAINTLTAVSIKYKIPIT